MRTVAFDQTVEASREVCGGSGGSLHLPVVEPTPSPRGPTGGILLTLRSPECHFRFVFKLNSISKSKGDVRQPVFKKGRNEKSQREER